MEAQHVATPWKIYSWLSFGSKKKSRGKLLIKTANGLDEIADFKDGGFSKETNEANAAYAVKAVNAHDELLAALKAYHREYWSERGVSSIRHKQLCIACPIIAKAEGK